MNNKINNIDIVTLDSGVRVVLEPLENIRSCSFGVWVRAGAIDENKDNSGVSHFIEHMMFKGTEKRDARKIAFDIDKIGGQINAFTGKEATCYYVKTTGEHFIDGADIILDMLNNSLFDSREMTKERAVILEEMKMTQDQPDDLAHDKVTELVFSGNPLAKSIIGTNTSLKRITRPVMVEYRNKEYTRDSMVVSVAGNFNKEKVLDYLEGKFSNFNQSKPKKNHDLVDYLPKSSVIVKDIQQSHLCLGTKGLDLEHPMYYSLNLLNSIMGGSMSSRFFQNIREKKGLAYSVFSMMSGFSNDGYFNIYMGVGHNKIKDALKGVMEELDNLDKNNVTEEELNMAKEQMKSGYIFSQENVASRMFANGKSVVLMNKIHTGDEIVERINSVNLDDIKKTKELVCDISKYSLVAVTNKKINLNRMWK